MHPYRQLPAKRGDAWVRWGSAWKAGAASRKVLARLKLAARKLFVERGYDATRPQDIAREAGLGHGTFYLHYPDKRACFLSFVEDARQELDAHLRTRRQPGATLEAAYRHHAQRHV